MRLFIAIELSDFAAAHLGRLQDALRPLAADARWTRSDQFHLTLKFLGEMPDGQVDALVKTLRRIKLEDKIRLHVDALVFFPPHGSVHVIAAALHDDGGRCAALQQEIDRTCHEAGFMLERRWTAHVTLARLKNRSIAGFRQSAAAAVAELLPGPSFSVEDFALIQSRLDRHGPTYLRVG